MSGSGMPAASSPTPSGPSPSAPAKKRSRLSLQKTVLLLLIIILVLELGLRFIFGLGAPLLYVVDKGEQAGGCGYLLAPDQDIRRFFAHNKTNHFSMRSDDFPEKKLTGHLRVLFVGDSVAYGTTFVDQAEIFTSLLARDLPARTNKPTDVLNASCSGWSVANELGFLKSRGTFDADLVVLVINNGDFTQRFADFPGGVNYPTAAPWSSLGEAWSRYAAPRLFGASNSSAEPGMVDATSGDLPEVTRAVFDRLADAKALVLKANAKFAILYSPGRGPVWDNPDFLPGKKTLPEWCAAQQVPLIDLTPDYATHSTEDLYLSDRGLYHTQLSIAGHQIAATRLLKDLPTLLSPATTPTPGTAK